jgi:NTE family protein
MLADGVFSGGGVKGIAFAGALKAAEEADYTTWVRVAGTSAGAITAMTLAQGYGADGIKDALDRAELEKLADTGGPIGEIGNLLTRRGVARGKALHQWLADVIAQSPRKARTFGELTDTRLQVIGADLAHRRRVVFPDDVRLYQDEHGRPLVPEEFPIADAVRISTGYPFYFPPLELKDVTTGKQGALVDGGVSSAFPVFLFDRLGSEHPTWGFRLYSGHGPEKPVYEPIGGLNWPLEMLRAVLDTAINAADAHDLLTFGDRTVSIPTDDVPTLAFDLTPAQRDLLYRLGYETAAAFFAKRPLGTNSLGVVPAQSKALAQPGPEHVTP